MPRIPLFICAAALVMAAGCSGEPGKPPGDSAAGGAMQVAGGTEGPGPKAAGGSGLFFEPADIHRGTTVRVLSKSGLPAGAKIDWLVNGEVVHGGDGMTLDTARFRKGDSIQARAVVAGGTLESLVVKIRNSLPEIRGITFVGGGAGQAGSMGVEVDVHDADGDHVKLDIAWRKNGEPAGAGSRLGAHVKRGDKIDVSITPHDGEEPGRSATLHREIRNAPPVIEGQEQFKVSAHAVTFRVRAFDPDGDSLTFAVKDAPAGVTIDKATGWIRMESPPGKTGKVPFHVMVSDGAGGETTALLNVTVAEELPSGAR